MSRSSYYDKKMTSTTSTSWKYFTTLKGWQHIITSLVVQALLQRIEILEAKCRLL